MELYWDFLIPYLKPFLPMEYTEMQSSESHECNINETITSNLSKDNWIMGHSKERWRQHRRRDDVIYSNTSWPVWEKDDHQYSHQRAPPLTINMAERKEEGRRIEREGQTFTVLPSAHMRDGLHGRSPHRSAPFWAVGPLHLFLSIRWVVFTPFPFALPSTCRHLDGKGCLCADPYCPIQLNNLEEINGIEFVPVIIFTQNRNAP